MFRTKAISSLLINSVKVLTDSNGLLTRNLYAPSAIGIESFLTVREKVKLQISNIDNFKAKMQEFVSNKDSKNLIFTEDLKNMVHISESADIGLLTQMIEKFCSQSREIRFGNFVFGPPVMRLFHHLKDCDNALSLFKNESLDGFFDQLISYQIILDLLFVNERYQDVLDTYEVIKGRQVQGGRYPKHVFVLTLAACYKLNTPASLDYAGKLYKEALESGHQPMRRGVTFFAALAMNQNQPQVALEAVSTVRQQNYLTIRCIRALALSNLKRFEDVIQILKSVLENENPLGQKQTFPLSVIDQVKKDFESNTNKDLEADFNKVIGFLEKHAHITQNTLDSILCAEIVQTVQSPGNDRYPPRDNRFGNNEGNNRYQRDNRDGNYEGNNRYQRDNRDGNDDGRDSRDYRPRYDRNERRGGFQRRELDGPSGRMRPGLHELN